MGMGMGMACGSEYSGTWTWHRTWHLGACDTQESSETTTSFPSTHPAVARHVRVPYLPCRLTSPCLASTTRTSARVGASRDTCTCTCCMCDMQPLGCSVGDLLQHDHECDTASSCPGVTLRDCSRPGRVSLVTTRATLSQPLV